MENKTLQKLAEAFRALPSCTALAVAGSRTAAIKDRLSDWDIYIYSDERIDPSIREEILSSIADSHMICSSFFEEGDEFIKDGVYYDLMYRGTGFVDEQIDRVWKHHQPSLGYSTCFLFNLKTSNFLFDKAGLEEKIKVLSEPYPDELASSIIDYNLCMMDGESEGSWMMQLMSAQRRGDFVSRNHRLAAAMASYFDVLLAYNRALHPGEKKLMGYCHLLCKALPEDFDEDMERIYSRAYEGDLVEAVRIALSHLKELVGRA